MSRRRVRDRRMVAGSSRLAATDDAALTAPVARRVPVRSKVNTVDRLTNRPASPLTDLQAEALTALSDVPAGPTALASRCSLSAKQMHNALWGLAGKGLAVRKGDGWVRA